jgi:hypothetical protein
VAFFDILNDILFHKKGDKLDNVDSYSEFSPFLVNRWCSMHSPNMCKVVNDTVNRYHSIFEDKADLYKLYIHFIPKASQRYIRYIKKKKIDPDEIDVEVAEKNRILAKSLELSEKEISMYIQYEQEHRSASTD